MGRGKSDLPATVSDMKVRTLLFTKRNASAHDGGWLLVSSCPLSGLFAKGVMWSVTPVRICVRWPVARGSSSTA